jgi:hypothetical protein
VLDLEGVAELTLDDVGYGVLVAFEEVGFELAGVLDRVMTGVLDLVEETRVEEERIVDETTGWWFSWNEPSILYLIHWEYG